MRKPAKRRNGEKNIKKTKKNSKPKKKGIIQRQQQQQQQQQQQEANKKSLTHTHRIGKRKKTSQNHMINK